MLNWKAWFDSKILERGKDYFRGGAVQDLEIDEDEISAVVEGTDEYQVTISLSDGEIDAMDKWSEEAKAPIFEKTSVTEAP
ncbi:MAG: hypothetical protein IJJ60_01990, partial [Clostridia bacterium]|nr:hypothetical protein [Clostridia bacterium]